MLTLLHLTLNFFLLLGALFVFLSENSVHSILFLVLSFLNSAIICFFFGADFIGLVLVIVYVGAIAILFLFVVMMLNVKKQEIGFLKYSPIIITFSLIFFAQIYLVTETCFSNFNFLESSFDLFESLSNEFFLGQTLYNYFTAAFLIAGIILLVGMIGAIILTLNFNETRINEVSSRQLSRSDSFLSFF